MDPVRSPLVRHQRRLLTVAAFVVFTTGSTMTTAPALLSPDRMPEQGTTATIDPPADSPLDRTVGGEALATTGVPIVDESAPALPPVDGRSWLIANAESGAVLAALSPHERRPPASTLKLLTAIATDDVTDPNERYTASVADTSIEGSRVGLTAGQEYRVGDLLYGLILASGNDAAHALAEAAGGQDVTVELMNDEARALGAFDTHAVTPHGLDSPGQLSSAYDLALIGRTVLDDDTLTDLARTTSYDFPGTDGTTFQIQNQNRLLNSYDGAIGLKAGYTTQAQHTFVGAAKRDGQLFIVTILGATGRAEDSAAALLDWAFADPDVDPVGDLVTTDDVADLVADAEDGDIFGAYQDVLDSSGTPASMPMIVWLALAAATVAGGIGFVMRRRRPRTDRLTSRHSPPSE